MLKAGHGSGASGSFFFFTKCRRFIIKTLRRDEKKVLLDMLDDYCKHLTYSNNESLLTRIYGVFTIKVPTFAEIDLIIMQNTSLVHNKNARTLEFDLKGSLKGRKTQFNPYAPKTQKTLKDLNYLEIQKTHKKCIMDISEQTKENLQLIISSDAEFLRQHNLMDYSLLIQIEKVRSLVKKERKRNVIYSQNCDYIYHIGIIDFLQDYSLAKKMETTIKTL